MASIALVNPNRLQPGVAPVAVEYLAAELTRRDVEVNVLDLCHVPNPKRAIREFFAEVHPDIVGISIRNLDDVVFNCFLAGEMIGTIECIKECANAPIVVGGSGFSIGPELLLDLYGLDLGVVGEGEDALYALLDKRDPKSIPGVIVREGAGFVKVPPVCADVRSFHFAKRGCIRYENYAYKGGKRGSAGVQTKRGCPNGCIYCVVPIIEGRTVRTRDPKDIADEMENLAGLGIKRIFLADSEFNYPREHAEEVCEEFIARGMKNRLSWQAYVSPGNFDTTLAMKMKEAGCDLVIGTLDSGVDALLERWRKPFRSEDVVTCVRACQEAGQNATYCLTLGGPGETAETLLTTLTLMRSLKPAKVTFGEPPGLRIYPGIPLEEIVKEEGFTPANPNLKGQIKGNENLLYPVYYLSAQMGPLLPVIAAWRKLGQVHHSIVAR